jgi:hypothetical protein
MDPLELLRSRNRFDVTLPSGLNVTIRLPRIRDCVIAGSVPLPVLQHIQAVASDGETALTPDEMAAGARFQDEIARQTLVAIDGEVVTLMQADLSDLAQEDYDALVSYGLRATPIPKAGALT